MGKASWRASAVDANLIRVLAGCGPGGPRHDFLMKQVSQEWSPRANLRIFNVQVNFPVDSSPAKPLQLTRWLTIPKRLQPSLQPWPIPHAAASWRACRTVEKVRSRR